MYSAVHPHCQPDWIHVQRATRFLIFSYPSLLADFIQESAFFRLSEDAWLDRIRTGWLEMSRYHSQVGLLRRMIEGLAWGVCLCNGWIQGSQALFGIE